MRYAFPPRILGVVPAKGASTRLARKNIRALGGKPLLGWAADAARATDRFDRLVVSTEDEEVAAVARRHGLEVPFMRPRELAVDPVEADGVALHAIEALADRGEQYDVVAIMLPTCPFRTADDIAAALDLFFSRSEPNLMSLSPFTHTPFAALIVDPSGLATPVFPDLFGAVGTDASGGVSPERCHSRTRRGVVPAQPILPGKPDDRVCDAARAFGRYRHG